jgi:hypothetical protein
MTGAFYRASQAETRQSTERAGDGRSALGFTRS